jgi:WD40 repeat protein
MNIMKPKPKLLFSGVTGHKFSVMRLAVFHHSNRFASCSFDGTVRIWDEMNQQSVLFFFPEAIEGLEITPDDKKLIVVLADSSKAYVHDLTKNSRKEIGAGKVFRSILGTSPDSSKTALVTYEDEVYIYKHETNSLGSRVVVDNISGDSLIWLNNNILAIPKRNGSVAVINTDERTIINEFQIHDGLITSIFREGEEITTVSEDGTGKVHDLNFKPKFGFKLKFTPQSVFFSSQHKTIVVSGDRFLLFVDMPTGQLTLTSQDLSGCNPVITKNGFVVRGTGANNISKYSTSGKNLDLIPGRTKTVESAVFLNDHSLVYGSGDNAVHRLDFKSGIDESLSSHSESVSSIVYISGTETIIAGAFDDTISLYQLPKNSEIKRIKNVPLVTTLALSPSETLFAAGCSGDNSIHIFNSTGAKLTSWEAHDDYVNTISFLNDEVIVSGSDDESVRFWSPSGKLIGSLKVSAPVKSIFTKPEFNYNVVGLENGEIVLIEKTTNRKIGTYTSSASIQCIKIVDSSRLFFAAKDILYVMELDGPNIISVEEVCRHTEPIKALLWKEEEEIIISIDHSIEIKSTKITTDESLTESSTIVFTPGESVQEERPETSSDKLTESAVSSNGEALVKIIEYLKTISTQFDELILPKLKEIGVDSKTFQEALQALEQNLSFKLAQVDSAMLRDSVLTDQDDESESDASWKSFDWGKRRR